MFLKRLFVFPLEIPKCRSEAPERRAVFKLQLCLLPDTPLDPLRFLTEKPSHRELEGAAAGPFRLGKELHLTEESEAPREKITHPRSDSSSLTEWELYLWTTFSTALT